MAVMVAVAVVGAVLFSVAVIHRRRPGAGMGGTIRFGKVSVCIGLDQMVVQVVPLSQDSCSDHCMPVQDPSVVMVSAILADMEGEPPNASDIVPDEY